MTGLQLHPREFSFHSHRQHRTACLLGTGRDRGEANSDRGTAVMVQGHGSPPCTSLFSIQGTRSFKRASRAINGITPCPPQGKLANMANEHNPASVNRLSSMRVKAGRKHDHTYFHQQTGEGEEQSRTVCWQSLLPAAQMHWEQDVCSQHKYTLRV